MLLALDSLPMSVVTVRSIKSCRILTIVSHNGFLNRPHVVHSELWLVSMPFISLLQVNQDSLCRGDKSCCWQLIFSPPVRSVIRRNTLRSVRLRNAHFVSTKYKYLLIRCRSSTRVLLFIYLLICLLTCFDKIRQRGK